MALAEFTFDPDKIKIRWEEPYVSEGLNRKLSMLPSGVYRGASCGPTSPTSQSLRFGPDVYGVGTFVDTMIVWNDLNNGYSVVIHDADTHVIDMSSRFSSGGTIPFDETWYLWIDAVYVIGDLTVATFHVTLTTPPIGSIKFGKVDMKAGDATIEAARFNFAWTYMSFPVPKEMRAESGYVFGDQVFGFLSGGMRYNIPTLAQKDGLTAASPQPSTSNPLVTKANTLDKVLGEPSEVTITPTPGWTSFQLTGWYYVGKGEVGSANHYFELHRKTSVSAWKEMLVGSDGHVITVGSIRKDSGGSPGSEVVPSSDADAKGFVQNPWVEGDFSKTLDVSFTATPILVWCSQKSDFSNLIAGAIADARRANRTHVDSVYGGALVGSPSSVAQGVVGGQMLSILGLINDRIKSIHPTVTSTTWILLWRSNNIANDAGVTQGVVSLYWKNGNFAVIIGGYFSTSTGNIITGSGTCNVTFQMWSYSSTYGGRISGSKKDASAATSLSPYDILGWDSWSQDSPYEVWDLVDDFARLFHHKSPGAHESYEMMYGGVGGSDPGWRFCFNCSWDRTANRWVQGDSARDSSILAIVNGSLVYYFRTLGAGPWADSDWDYVEYISHTTGSGRGRACPMFPTGSKIYDRLVYSFYVTNLSGSAEEITALCAVTFHSYLTDITDGTYIDVLLSEEINWEGLPTLEDVEPWGCVVRGTSDEIGAGVSAKQFGEVLVSKT